MSANLLHQKHLCADDSRVARTQERRGAKPDACTKGLVVVQNKALNRTLPKSVFPAFSCHIPNKRSSRKYLQYSLLQLFNWFEVDRRLIQLNLLYRRTHFCTATHRSFILATKSKSLEIFGIVLLCGKKSCQTWLDFAHLCFKVSAQCKELTFPLRDLHPDEKHSNQLCL